MRQMIGAFLTLLLIAVLACPLVVGSALARV